MVDVVGYGTGTNCFEGTGPTGTISATLAALRLDNGCTDTDNNSTDFSTTGAPAPRNTRVAACALRRPAAEPAGQRHVRRRPDDAPG